MSIVVQRTAGTYHYMQNASDTEPLYVIYATSDKRFKIDCYTALNVDKNPFENFNCASLELAQGLIDYHLKCKNNTISYEQWLDEIRLWEKARKNKPKQTLLQKIKRFLGVDKC